MSQWQIGVDLTHWVSYNQLNLDQTSDGSQSENSSLNCGESSVAAVGRYITGAQMDPDHLKDTWFYQGYTGPSDLGDIVGMLSLYDIPSTIYSAKTAQEAANIVYDCLFYGRPCIVYLKGGDGKGHYVDALTMSGGASSNPFDTWTRDDPWGGQNVSTDYTWFASNLKSYYQDGLFKIVVPNRDRAEVMDSKMGPAPL